MEITVSIPDNFVTLSEASEDVSRQMLEAYAIEGYRQLRLSLGQISELLGLSIDETHGFLKLHNVPSNYGLDDLARDRKTLELFLKK